MKVLFAIKALDNVNGGAERVLADISSGLENRDHDISIMSFDKPGGTSFYPLNNKVKRIALGIGNTRRKATVIKTISRMIAIRRTVLSIKPDVLIAFMHSTFIPASIALIGTGVPVIASEHIVPEHYKDKIWEYILLHFSQFFVKRITVLSEAIKQTYTPFLRKKMIAIANPVHSAEVSTYSGHSTHRKIILNVGRLTKQKDQETLVKAFAKLTPEYPEWNLRIIGEGELRHELNEIIHDHNLENIISLPGTISDIESEYQKAHIFALPSRYESFGLATAEAMAHGLPTIGFSNCPGTNELIIHQENGLLVQGNENRVDSFTEGLKKLMDSSQLREKLGKSGLQTVKQYHPNIIIQKWENLINEICSS